MIAHCWVLRIKINTYSNWVGAVDSHKPLEHSVRMGEVWETLISHLTHFGRYPEFIECRSELVEHRNRMETREPDIRKSVMGLDSKRDCGLTMVAFHLTAGDTISAIIGMLLLSTISPIQKIWLILEDWDVVSALVISLHLAMRVRSEDMLPSTL